jgi:predicted NAD-dependent protein-ADP-ribosyltransferase YbiA (DUF1768 family)
MALLGNYLADAETKTPRSQPRESRETSGKPGDDWKLVNKHLMDNTCRAKHSQSAILQKWKYISE